MQLHRSRILLLSTFVNINLLSLLIKEIDVVCWISSHYTLPLILWQFIIHFYSSQGMFLILPFLNIIGNMVHFKLVLLFRSHFCQLFKVMFGSQMNLLFCAYHMWLSCQTFVVPNWQELHDVKRKNSALQMQRFVGEEKNDLLDYLRSLQPEKVRHFEIFMM